MAGKRAAAATCTIGRLGSKRQEYDNRPGYHPSRIKTNPRQSGLPRKKRPNGRSNTTAVLQTGQTRTSASTSNNFTRRNNTLDEEDRWWWQDRRVMCTSEDVVPFASGRETDAIEETNKN